MSENGAYNNIQRDDNTKNVTGQLKGHWTRCTPKRRLTRHSFKAALVGLKPLYSATQTPLIVLCGEPPFTVKLVEYHESEVGRNTSRILSTLAVAFELIVWLRIATDLVWLHSAMHPFLEWQTLLQTTASHIPTIPHIELDIRYLHLPRVGVTDPRA